MGKNRPRYARGEDAAAVLDRVAATLKTTGAAPAPTKETDMAKPVPPPADPQRRMLSASCRKVKDKGDRVRRFIGTDETPDRYNTVIKVDGWHLEGFKQNPVFMWAHGQDAAVPQFPLGRVVLVESTTVDERGGEDRSGKRKALAFEVEFYDDATKHPTADLVLDLYDKGFLNAVSVGFRNLKSRHVEDVKELEELGFKEAKWAAVLEENELLELSAVPVPGNPNALIERLAEAAPETRAAYEIAVKGADGAPGIAWWARVIKKVGDEWCVFTKDGEKKLGCHATEAKAKAQLAAIEAGKDKAAAPETRVEEPCACRLEVELWTGEVAGRELRLTTGLADMEFDAAQLARIAGGIRVALEPPAPEAAPSATCEYCELARAGVGHCDVHAPCAQTRDAAKPKPEDELMKQVAALEARIRTLEATANPDDEDGAPGDAPSGVAPARTYLDDVLAEVETFERLHGALLPRTR